IRDTNCYLPYFGMSFFPKKNSWGRYKYFFLFRISGFRKRKNPHPYANKCMLVVELFFRRFQFRVGIQQRTWFYFISEDVSFLLYKLRNKIYHKNKKELPF